MANDQITMNAHTHLSGSAARVFATLIGLAAGSTTVCADYSIISQSSGASRGTVAGAIRELAIAGYITVDRQHKRQGGCYCYQLNFQKSESSTFKLSDGESSSESSKVELSQGVKVQSHELSHGSSPSLSHEMNDEMNDDESVRLIFSQLAEAGLKGPNAQWLAKTLAPKPDAPETIKRISSEVDSQKSWRKPAAVKYRKLEAYALGLQDPLPHFEGELGTVEKPKAAAPSAPKGQRPARATGKGKTYRRAPAQYDDEAREAAKVKNYIQLAELRLSRGEVALDVEIATARARLEKTNSDILRDWIARKTKTEVNR